MPSVQYLREFINERLTAAAEQIFLEFEKTIVQYEEEIDRQRRLLDITWKPEIKLHRTDVPQQHVSEEEEVPPVQQLWNQERSSSLDQEEPEPPQIKEEQEELCSSQEGEQLGLKEETDTFMVTFIHKESDQSKPDLVSWDQLLSHSSDVTERQSQRRSKTVDSGSSRNRKKSHKNADDPPTSENHSDTSKRAFKCDVCGKAFKQNYEIKRHYRIHTGEKPYPCKTCNKMFAWSGDLLKHMRVHTGEKPFSCKTCLKMFASTSSLSSHMRTHTGEKPYTCKACGKMFAYSSDVRKHMRIHTGEKPYHCKACGKMFGFSCSLLRHMKTHTSQKSCSF